MRRYPIKILKNDYIKFKWLLVVVALGIATLSTVYYYQQADIVSSQLKNPVTEVEKNKVADQEAEYIVELTGKHILLPTETPSIYLISDSSQVVSTYGDFFKDSVQGDYLLLYSKKAIVYRENEDIIVNVGPIALDTTNE